MRSVSLLVMTVYLKLTMFTAGRLVRLHILCAVLWRILDLVMQLSEMNRTTRLKMVETTLKYSSYTRNDS
jgi:hypothetical protein